MRAEDKMPTVLALTPSHLLTIAEIYKELKILTVKDKDTGKFVATKENPAPFSKMRPYGVKYAPVIKHMRSGEPVLDENHQHERVIQIRYMEASARFPGGVPVGVTLRHQRKTLRDFGGDDSMVMIGGQDDIDFDEWKRVETFMRMGRDRTSAEERAADEKMKEAMRAKRVLSDLDPTTALAKALAPILAQLAQGKPVDAPIAPAVIEAALPVQTREPGQDDEEDALVGVDLRTREGRALKAKIEAQKALVP